MKKITLLFTLLMLVGCSSEKTEPELRKSSAAIDGKTAAAWCYEEITTKTDAKFECYTTQELNVNDSTKSQFSYLITTWHSNSGYPVRTEWNCGISFNKAGDATTIYPKSSITYVNAERICVVEGRR